MFADLVKKLKRLSKGALTDNKGWFRHGRFTPLAEIKDYLSPTSNAGNNFWSTPTAKFLAGMQQVTTPPGGWGSAWQRVKSQPIESYFLPTSVQRGWWTAPEPVKQFAAHTQSALSFGLLPAKLPEPTTTLGKIGKYAGEMVGSIPAFELGEGAVAPLVEKAALPKLATKVATNLGSFAIGAGLTQTGGLKQRTEAAREQFSPAGIALAALPAVGMLGAIKARDAGFDPRLLELADKWRELDTRRAMLEDRGNAKLAVRQLRKAMDAVRDRYREIMAEKGKLPIGASISEMPSKEEAEKQLGELAKRVIKPEIGKSFRVKFLDTDWGKKLAQKFGKETDVKVLSEPKRFRTGAVMVQAEVGGKKAWLPISKHVEWKEANPTIKIKPPSEPPISEGNIKIGKERGFIKTVKEAPTTKEELAKAVEGTYQPMSSEQLINQAKDFVEKNGWDAAKEKVFKEPLSPDTNAIGQQLMMKAQNEGRYQDAVEIAEELAKKGTKAGQTVQAFSIWSKMTPEGMLRYAQKQVKGANEKMGIASKFIRKALGKKAPKIDAKDAEAITKYMKLAQKATNEEEKAVYVRKAFEVINKKIPWGISDVLDEYRYNNMLSNPLTHLRNLYSNLIQTYFTRPATLASRGKIKQAAQYELGAIKALPDALSAFRKSLKGGARFGKMDINNPQLLKPRVLGKWNTISDLMEASDQFFSTLIKQGELARGASKEEAEKAAQYYLFRQDLHPKEQGYLLNKIDDITKATYQLRRVGLGWFIPFVRTPMNVAKQWIEYAPTGIATVAGAAQKKEQLSKAMLGSLFTLMGAELAMQGRTTWAVPTDPVAKRLFYDSGRKPYSVKIGNKWVPAMYFGPFALALLLPAAVKYYTQESRTALTDDQITKLTKIMMSGLGFWSQQTFVSGLGSFVNLVEGKQDYSIPKELAYTAGQLKPMSGLLRYITTLLDPVYRKARGFRQQFIADVPFLSKTITPYMTSLGEPAKRNITNYIAPYAMGISRGSLEQPYQQRMEKLRQNAVINQARKRLEEANLQSGVANISMPDKLKYYIVANKLDKYFQPEPTGAVAKTKFESNKFKAAVKLYRDKDISDDDKQAILTQIGINPDDIAYYDIATSERSVRRAAVNQMLRQSGKEGLIALRKTVHNKRILTSTIINDMVKEGVLTYGEGKYLKSIKWVKNKITGGLKIKARRRRKIKIGAPPKMRKGMIRTTTRRMYIRLGPTRTRIRIAPPAKKITLSPRRKRVALSPTLKRKRQKRSTINIVKMRRAIRAAGL